MSIRVKTFSDKELNEAIKQSPNIVQEYIQSLKYLAYLDMRTMEEFGRKWQKVPPDIQAVINKEFHNLV